MASQTASIQSLPSSSEDRGPPFRAFVIALVVITTLATILRFWSRSLNTTRLKCRFWWDDAFVAASAVAVLTELSLALRIIDLGFGKHIWAIPPANSRGLLKLFFGAEILFNFSLLLAKTSALLFFRRVFPHHASPRWFNIGLWICHGLNTAWFVGIILSVLLDCNPISKKFNPTVPGECGKASDIYIGNAVPSIVIDLLILILPVPMIWGIQTSRIRKASITLVFILAYSSVVVSIGRLVTVLRAGKSIDEDFTYEGLPHYYWVLVEVPILIVSITLPAMLPLARHIDRTYYKPLVSNLSGLFTNINSRNNASSGTDADPSHPSTFHDSYPWLNKGEKSDVNENAATELEDMRYSGDSRRQMLEATGSQGFYTVLGAGLRHPGGVSECGNSGPSIREARVPDV
ncbi:hypothetical protein F5Y01DRAFT_311706 [Xylaria sp. FL0043]|nr:hypothetical protein F5Y01DRAFT_311706 [Xylaria sp. FL0043]